jgi:hypothetical protein
VCRPFAIRLCGFFEAPWRSARDETSRVVPWEQTPPLCVGTITVDMICEVSDCRIRPAEALSWRVIDSTRSAAERRQSGRLNSAPKPVFGRPRHSKVHRRALSNDRLNPHWKSVVQCSGAPRRARPTRLDVLRCHLKSNGRAKPDTEGLAPDHKSTARPRHRP